MIEELNEVPNYCRAAIDYAEGVCTGKIEAPEHVRVACQRQLDDIDAELTGKLPYHFDIARAEAACEAIERHLDVKLEPAQCLALTTMFGWVDEQDRLRVA